MTTTAPPTYAAGSTEPQSSYGKLGRLGLWTAGHFRIVLVVWAVIALGFGVFAPKAQHALAGAGWEASGSQSVQARALVNREFSGLSSSALQVVVHTSGAPVTTPAARSVITSAERQLASDPRISIVVPPVAGQSISADGRTAVIQGGAASNPNTLVRAADHLAGPLSSLSTSTVTVTLTGSSALWSEFNAANHSAMMRSELYSWPVTMVILVLAFGSLIAAGLPLMLTLIGLLAAAGSLYLGTQIGAISIWAMNFALMFALALGIDYALFLVVRFRGALSRGLDPRQSVAETMDAAGKAVLFSGLTVLVSLSAVMLVPSPAFRSMALGIMLSVVFVLAATLTLLPAVLARLGGRVDGLALPWVHAGEHRSPRFARWGERLWRQPLRFGLGALVVLLLLAAPIVGLRTGMPSIKVLPASASARVGYDEIQQAFGPGAPGTLEIVTPATSAAAAAEVLNSDAGVSHVLPTMTSANGQYALINAVPATDPSAPALGTLVDRLRGELPPGSLVGGAAAENHDLERVLSARTPLVIGVVLLLGFLLLLVALAAPLIALLGVVTNLLAVGAAFGVARLIFQNGHGQGLFGFQSQGFIDAWAPVFFFAMIFAISMDYTVFLLSSAKEHWERSHDAREAMVGAVAHSGRVVFAAAAVMVAVFFTFALSGPLPPKEMGVVLGVAVLLDALLVRLMLLPVLLRLIGPAGWSCPRWLRRALPDVRFGH